MKGQRIQRRSFLTLLGGAAAAWPLGAKAQQRAMPVIGFLSGGSPAGFASGVIGFRNGLNETGFVEGRNVAIDYQWMDGQFERLPETANDLVRRRVAVIFASGGVVSALAAKAATSTIPIVFANGSDPVKFGLVASFNRPGGNITGVSFLAIALEQKRIELLRELIPKGGVIAVLLNQNNPNADGQSNDVQTAARILDQPIVVLNAGTDRDLQAALATLVERQVSAFTVTADSFLAGRDNEMVAVAARHRLPTMGLDRPFAMNGGLMTYGPDIGDAYRQGGIYTGRILKGERPTDLPVVQPTKFELVINLKTAKSLGLDVPDKLLALADQVIE